MKNLLLAAFLLCSALAIPLSAKSMVWKAEKDDSTLYLGGTVHALRTSDLPLPDAFDQAYAASEILVFETDITAMSSPQFQAKVMAEGTYKDGKSLKDFVSKSTYEQLEAFCQKKNLPIESVASLKPGIASMTVSVIELMGLGVTPIGVDAIMHGKANSDNKSVEWFETVDEQLGFLLNLGKGSEDALIKSSLSQAAQMKEMFDQVIQNWKQGEADQLGVLMVEEMKTETPEAYQELIVDRNHNWLPQIHAYQKTAEIEFILVGAGHLVGEDGIIKALKDDGFEITQL